MEKEVAKWLHTQLGYNASADNTLSANCRGNLKSLWAFLMARYTAPENKRRIQLVLSKHRREQEAARRAPQRQQEALQQKQYLQQLEQTAAALHRTLASLQMALDNNIQDAVEQHGEHALHMQELHESQSQALLLQACTHSNQQLVPLLQAQLAKLRGILEVAQARSQASAAISSRRSQAVQQQLQQATNSIRQQLEKALEETLTQQQPGSADTAQQDQQGAGSSALSSTFSSPGSADKAAAHASVSSSCWGELKAPAALAGDPLQHLQGGRYSLVCSCNPSEALKSAVMRLLHEPPSLLMACSSQLAGQACQELTALLADTQRGLDQGPEQQQPTYRLPWASGASLSSEHLPDQAHIEKLVGERQRLHVELFVLTQRSKSAARAAESQLTMLLGSTPLLSAQAAGRGAWEWELASLWLRVERLRAEVATLKQRTKEFQADVACCCSEEEELNQQWEQIMSAERDDAVLNHQLWQLATDNFELAAALQRQQSDVMKLLGTRLGPSSRSAMQSANAGRDELQRELGVVGRLPVAALAVPQLLADLKQTAPGGGAGLPPSHPATLERLQLAAQRLSHAGRPTTCGRAFRAAAGAPAAAGSAQASLLGRGLVGAAVGGSRGVRVDAAAVSALAAATAAVDAMAPAKCPAALLLEVAGRCREVQQLQQQLGLLDGLSSTAASTAAAGAGKLQQLRHKLHDLHSQQQHEVLPRLQELQEEVCRAQEFATQEVAADISQLWEMPAQHLLPDHTYEGKSCSEWLMEVQALHGRKRELTSTTRPATARA